MSEVGTVDLQSCCRLCLSDKQDQLKSVFAISDLPSRILQHVAIEITINDKISKQICQDCTLKINEWHLYREKCVLNQNKLANVVTSQTNHNASTMIPNISMLNLDMSIHIKDEPMTYDEMSQPEDQTAIDKTVVVKDEPVDVDFAPPMLTPYRSEDESQHQRTPTTVPDPDDEGRKCPQCDKIFANRSNRKKHEVKVHRQMSPLDARRNQMIEISDVRSADASSSEDVVQNKDSQSENSMESTADSRKSTEPASEEDQQKIQFAAGLKLLEKNSTPPISCEALSKIELSYIEKCKAMVNMYKTLVCACHNVEHSNLKGLLSHLRALRIWFPVFTCYNCMITYTDRSSFGKHHAKCNKGHLETIEKLSNLRKRSEIKLRLYQNYKCISCKYLFFFHEDYIKHVDEDHINGCTQLKCPCKRSFDNLDEYKSHVYYSCLVNFYCDICFVTLKTLDLFLKHAQAKHDNSSGFILLQEDNYMPKKPLPQRNSLNNSNSNDENSSPEKQDKVEEKVAQEEPPQLEPSEPMERKSGRPRRERKSSVKGYSTIDNEDEEEPTSRSSLRDQYSYLKHLKSNQPSRCPICNKKYSSFHNMLRHYKSHSEEEKKATEKDHRKKYSESIIYSCPDCGGMYNSDDWMVHLKTHPIKNCDMCEKSFQFQTELDHHRNSHLNIKVYRDSKTKVYKSSMVTQKAYPCEICNAEFPSEEEVDKHKDDVHYSEDMPMLEPLAIITEPDQVEEKKQYPCEQCGRIYGSYNSLWGHRRDKHSDKPSIEYPKQCDLCDKVCMTGTSYASHKRMHSRMSMGIFPKGKVAAKVKSDNQEDESYHTCNKCFKVFSSKSNLKNHMLSHKTVPMKTPSPSKKHNKKVWCDICHVGFNGIDLLNEHKQEEHNDGMPTLFKADEIDTKVSFICDFCNLAFSNKILLKKHKEEQHLGAAKVGKSLVYCRYCKVSFNSVLALTKHMHVEHNETAKPKVVKEGVKEAISKPAKADPKPHKCTICKKAFATVAALQAHSGWHKRTNTKFSVQPAVQKKNEKVAKYAKVVSKNRRPSSPIAPPEFQCSTCLIEFPNDTALQIHVLEKHRNVNAIMLIPRCNICDKDFETQEEYDTHKRFHDFLERQKNHEMQQAVQISAIPTTKSGAVQISAVPAGKSGKSFPCKFCNSAFSRSDSLGAHVKLHHKEHLQTEFKCHQCDRVFEKQNSLTIHLKVHEKQRAGGVNGTAPNKAYFHCSICNMGFDLPKDLRAHTIKAHPF